MNSTQHPLVTRDLDDLGRMLDHLPPGDRAEVLAGVHEHIETGLAERRGATDADVSAVLAELGPPEIVAREAYGTEYAAGSPQRTGAGEPGGTRWSDRPWVPVVVAVLQVLALLLLLAAVGGGAGAVVSGLWLLPPWIGIALLVGNSRLWVARHKLVHLLLLPVSALVVGVGGWQLVRLTRAGRASSPS